MTQEYDTNKMSDEEIRQAFIRCFTSREGQIALSFLKKITLNRFLGPHSTADELRYLEGQRQLVAQIINLSNPKK